MGIIEDVKHVAKILQAAGNVELYGKISKLEVEVRDLIKEKALIENEKSEAEKRIKELQHALAFKDELVFKDPYFVVKGKRQRYCPACWRKSNIAVEIVTVEGTIFTERKCPACGVVYDTSTF